MCGEIVVNKYLEALQGLNLVALRRGFEEGPRALDRASRVAYIAARAAATRQQVLTDQQVNEIPVVRLTQVLGDKMCEVKLRVMRYEDDAVQ